MEKLLKTKLNLWTILHGRVIPQKVMGRIFDVTEEDMFDVFNEIYLDENRNILLASDADNTKALEAFWIEMRPGLKFPNCQTIDFILSPNYREIKEHWIKMLLYCGMEYAQYAKFIISLCEGLSYKAKDNRQVLLDALEKLDKEIYSADVYFAFCVIAMHFEYFEEDDLPSFRNVFGKFKADLEKTSKSWLHGR